MSEALESLLAVALDIRELLQLIAEPAIAQRDEKLRACLRQTVGKSQVKRNAVLLMNGSRSQKDILQEMKIDQSDLSKLVRTLRDVGLITPNEKPQLKIPIPLKFFEKGDEQ